MNIQLRFFASVREALGISHENLAVPDSVATVGAVRTLLQQRGGVWAEALADHKVLRMACNQHMTMPMRRCPRTAKSRFFRPSPVAEVSDIRKRAT